MTDLTISRQRALSRFADSAKMHAVDLDLFYSWRWLLMVVCTVYAVGRTGQSFWRWYAYLWSGDRSTLLMRQYLFVQLLRLRVHRYTLELAQIAVLLVLLAVISWAHRFV